MKNMTLYLPRFHLATLRRKPRSTQQILAERLAELKQKNVHTTRQVLWSIYPKTILVSCGGKG